MAEVDYDKFVEPTEGEPEEVVAEATEEVEEPKKESRENERVRQLVDEKNELKARVDAMEGLKEEILRLKESMKPPEPAPEPEVDFMEDPKEYVDNNKRALQARIEALEKQETEANELNKQEMYALKLQMSITEAERQFSSEHPDYLKALQYNREYRIEELKMMGVKDQNAVNVIAQEEIFLARNKIDTGESPAEAAYNLALKRGYKPQAVDIETVEKDLDEEVSTRQKAREAQSMGGSGVSSPAEVDNGAEHEAWESIVKGATEVYGEKAAREMFPEYFS